MKLTEFNNHPYVVAKKALKENFDSAMDFEKLSIEFCIGMTVANHDDVDGSKKYVFWISRFDRDPMYVEVKE